MFKEEDFIKIIKSYIGTPFVHQGRVPKIGIDCAGVVICALKELGLDFYDLNNYNMRPSQDDVLSKIIENGFSDVSINDMKKGDLLLMSYDGNIQHIAVVSETNPVYIIHAVTNKKVIEHRLDEVWKNRVKRVFRFKQI